MQFELLYEMQRPFKGTDIDWNTFYKETLEQCALADQMGFDNLWFVEHHFLTGFLCMGSKELSMVKYRIAFITFNELWIYSCLLTVFHSMSLQSVS